MDAAETVLTAIVHKTDNVILLFCVILAVMIVAIIVPLGTYYLKRFFDRQK